ncbi:MAG: hypothetical protein ACQERK_06985 [Campylobacterota bacterium]
MKKQIITLVVSATMAASSLYAFGGSKGYGNCDKSYKSCDKGGKMFSAHRGGKMDNSMRTFMMTLSDMDLSDKQWNEIKIVMMELKIERFERFEERKNTAFFDKEGNFDKKRFIDNRISISKNMATMEAKTVEKILNILDKKQRKEFTKQLSQ